MGFRVGRIQVGLTKRILAK